ncbi:MAG: arsenical resistance operon transcriptional repressor ArsD [Ignavibacteriales bacterium CG07_land_8_20_14_0_80_59_12]|nr:MAG: arsenical resistance operon transcriptional repressor ArsD [Ignavibacteriales bacterium CG07_land_8_20_14_0_80_59_12]
MEKAVKTELTTIEIFDPPMCCPSGLCGPSVDPALLDINEAVLKLKKEYDGKVTIERYLLSQQGQKFMQVPEVLALLKREGVSVLPLTMVNGKIIKQKTYPTYDELKLSVEETTI